MIRLLHIFPELLNLYGDYANLVVLKDALERMGAQAEIVKIAPGEEFSPAEYDLLYAGPGTEGKIELARRHLLEKSAEFLAAAEAGTPMLFFGSAAELACARISDGEEARPALGIFDAAAIRTPGRETGDVLYKSHLSDRLLAGFINKSGFIESAEPPLFEAVFGLGGRILDGKEQNTEGLYKNNVIASYVTGPALSKNPWLLEYIAGLVFERARPGESAPALPVGAAARAYEITVAELSKRA